MRVAKAKAERLVKEAKKQASAGTLLPLHTIIEVVAISDEKTLIKDMSFGDWLEIEKKPGFKYMAFEQGFSSFPGVIRI